MTVPDADWLRLGHTLLRFRGSEQAAAGERLVDLAGAGEIAGRWLAAGGLLGAQAVSPLAVVPPEEVSGAAFLGVGPGAALPALCCQAYGFARIVVLLPEAEHEALLAAAAGGPGRVEALAADATLPEARAFFRVAIGCAGRVPGMAELVPWIQRLVPEGQLILFGLPVTQVEAAFAALAEDGLALRACGFRGEEAYLAGSLEDSAVPGK